MVETGLQPKAPEEALIYASSMYSFTSSTTQAIFVWCLPGAGPVLVRTLKLGDPVAALKELPEKAEEHANRPSQKISALWEVKMEGQG